MPAHQPAHRRAKRRVQPRVVQRPGAGLVWFARHCGAGRCFWPWTPDRWCRRRRPTWPADRNIHRRWRGKHCCKSDESWAPPCPVRSPCRRCSHRCLECAHRYLDWANAWRLALEPPGDPETHMPIQPQLVPLPHAALSSANSYDLGPWDLGLCQSKQCAAAQGVATARLTIFSPCSLLIRPATSSLPIALLPNCRRNMPPLAPSTIEA